MPSKKKVPPHPYTKEVKEYETAPKTTVAMGLKMSKVSTDNWRAQILKESAVHDEWVRTHAPTLVDAEAAALGRSLQRLELAQSQRLAVPERGLLFQSGEEGGGRKAYLRARNRLPPQEKWTVGPTTSAQVVGWNVTNSALLSSTRSASQTAALFSPTRRAMAAPCVPESAAATASPADSTKAASASPAASLKPTTTLPRIGRRTQQDYEAAEIEAMVVAQAATAAALQTLASRC